MSVAPQHVWRSRPGTPEGYGYYVCAICDCAKHIVPSGVLFCKYGEKNWTHHEPTCDRKHSWTPDSNSRTWCLFCDVGIEFEDIPGAWTSRIVYYVENNRYLTDPGCPPFPELDVCSCSIELIATEMDSACREEIGHVEFVETNSRSGVG